MKLTTFFLATLSAIAAAQPHQRLHHKHPAKRDIVTEMVTDVVMTTQPVAIVYVNSNNEPVSTWYEGQPPATSTPAADEPSSTTPAAVYTAPTTPAPQLPGNTPDATPAPQATSAATSSSSSGSDSGSVSTVDMAGYGLSYSPYNNDGTCKTQDQVSGDFAAFSGYGTVRIYGTDCNQVSTVLTAARANNMKIFAGVYDVDDATTETQALIDAAQGDWTTFDSVAIGNEAVSNGLASVDQVVAAVKQARSTLRAAGFNGAVVTVETSAQVISNPALCEASDFAAANAHAFFNADLTADQAGTWVREQAERVSQACGGKDTTITESGWPSQGDTNGLAIPSPENQRMAIGSLKAAFASNLVLFSAFNDEWKQNTPGTFGAEQWWGIYGNAPL